MEKERERTGNNQEIPTSIMSVKVLFKCMVLKYTASRLALV